MQRVLRSSFVTKGWLLMFIEDPLVQEKQRGVDRRTFIKASAAGALSLGVVLRFGKAGADGTAAGLENVRGGNATPSLFITIEPSGTVKITCHRSEMGQQVWTALAQIVADELEARWDDVEVVQAIGHPKYGDQNTDGSRSVRYNLHRLRVAGAAMRAMLVAAAAKEWNVAPADCTSEQGRVHHAASDRSASYGELASAAAELTVPGEADITLKERAQWRYIGKGTPSLTVPRIVKGEGTFGIDVQLPDMLHAVIAHPPVLFATIASVDDSEARKTPGVVDVVRMDTVTPPAAFKPLGGVAVIARNTWAAIQGRKALKIEWDRGDNASYDSETYAQSLMETARRPGEVRRIRGDVDSALQSAATHVTAEYYAPHLAQAPMEPPAATARWSGDTVECWACTQTPQASRRTVAGVCGVAEDNVTINVTWLGGAFGRKSKPDFVAEAAILARQAGKPVKVTWTREDDLQNGYLHSVSAQRLEAGLNDKGQCTALLHRTVFPPIGSTFDPSSTMPSAGELRLGAADNPFALENLRLESGAAQAHVRIGWLRSVCNVYHAFAIQSFAAELAAAAGRDAKDYLLELIGPPRTIDPNTEGADYDNYGSPLEEYPIDTGRLAHVTRKAAEMAGWGRDLPKGHGLGIAAHRSFVSYVATVVEVAVADDGTLTIPGVWSAMDAGTVVNTNHSASQMEGGTLYGLSNALYGELSAKNGVIQQANFPDWRIMRMREAPRHFEVHIVESNAPPGGVGEPPTPPAAPALANAIFAATGLRIRRLPIFGKDGNKLDLTQQEKSS